MKINLKYNKKHQLLQLNLPMNQMIPIKKTLQTLIGRDQSASIHFI
jgi:hypothetical protein